MTAPEPRLLPAQRLEILDIAKIPFEWFKHDEDSLRKKELKDALKTGETCEGVKLSPGKKSLLVS
jgi:hypothetical protein